jgi:hypothetical protein
MQLAAPQPRRRKVLMSFRYWNAWDVIFFDTDDLGTTYESIGSLLAAVLTGTRSACELAVLTSLPFHFVRVVMTQMEVHGKWPSEGYCRP